MVLDPVDVVYGLNGAHRELLVSAKTCAYDIIHVRLFHSLQALFGSASRQRVPQDHMSGTRETNSIFLIDFQ